MEIEADRLRIGDGEAGTSLSLTYRWADATRRESPVSYDARFVQRDGAWHFGGYELDSLSGDALTVARFSSIGIGTDPSVALETQQLLSTTQQTYLALTADLGVEPITSTRCIYYPSVAAMRAIARPAANRETGWLAPSAEQVEISLGQPITPALVHLTLNQMGLPPDEGDWLREGLAIHYQDGGTANHLSALATADELVPLSEFPDLSDAPDSEALRAQAWGVTEFLLDTHGTAGLQALCAAWGRSGDLSSAFQQALGLSPTQFEAAWRAERLDPLRADAEAIQSTLAARAEAVLIGDEAGFLATVNPADPVLRTSERNWFADLTDHPLASYEAVGEVVGWSPDGEEATVALSVSLTTSSGQSTQVTYDARFVREGSRWLYAGVAWYELASEHLLLKYQAGANAFGPQRILDLAEKAYAQVAADLEVTPPLPQEIRIYDDAALFRASISPSLPNVSSWTGLGEGIKLWLQEESERFIQTTIARELTRQALLAQGLQTDWLHEGIATFEASRATSLGTHWAAGNHMSTVQEAIRRHNEFPLYDMPAWDDLPDDQADLFRAQSWSLISFIFERHGLAGLRSFVAQSITSDNAATNIQIALRVVPETFEAEWREHVRIAGVPSELVSLARRFDPELALAHVTTLASPELGGRRAGSSGADLAASYIAEQFAALGLEPLGDPLTGTQRSYLQQFPISYTHVVSVPTLTLLKADGTLLHEFTYRQDFMDSAGQGNARGELVWIRPSRLEGMYFGGAVVLEQDIDVERAQQLEEHGAGGVVIVTDEEPDDLQASYFQPASAPELSIPVFEITGVAFETLLGELGLERGELVSSPPALPLGVLARQTLARSPVTTTLTANVLGLLPGSDPEYSDEVLVVGAHYDHIGQLPDGFYFPGANQNGSGVAAMLEMARVWQSAGYRPARSVLFATWGAEEVDGAGVTRYLADPAVPLTQTVGVIALDTIAGGGGAKLMFHGTREHDMALIQRFEAGYAELDRRAWRQGSTGEGWHAPFNAAGIPTSKLIWDEAEEDFYLPTDTADRIDPDWLASSGEILTLVVSWLAGQ